MNTPEPEPTPTAATLEAGEPGSPTKPKTGKDPSRKLSASTEAFIAQMAENLRTHDPEHPKGRLRKQP